MLDRVLSAALGVRKILQPFRMTRSTVCGTAVTLTRRLRRAWLGRLIGYEADI